MKHGPPLVKTNYCKLLSLHIVEVTTVDSPTTWSKGCYCTWALTADLHSAASGQPKYGSRLNSRRHIAQRTTYDTHQPGVATLVFRLLSSNPPLSSAVKLHGSIKWVSTPGKAPYSSHPPSTTHTICRFSRTGYAPRFLPSSELAFQGSFP